MTNSEFLSKLHKQLGKCTELFIDEYEIHHICKKLVNHEENHKCHCEEEWPNNNQKETIK